MNPVAIIGGGITGLTAAFRLQQRGIPVTLYECAPRPGGVIQSVQQQGYLAESGPNTLLDTSPKIGSLIRDAGLEGRRLYSDPSAEKRYLVRRGRLLSLPGSGAGFLTSPLFSVTAKLRLMAEPFIRRAPADLEESVAEFVLRRIGREFLDYAINPFVAGVYAGDPARLSVTHAFPKLHALEQRYGSLLLGQIRGARARKQSGEVPKQEARKISFAGGLQELVDALALRLGGNLRLGTAVAAATRTREGWRLRLRPAGGPDTVGGPEKGADHSAVLYAGTAYALAGLSLTADRPIPLGVFGEIPYAPVSSLVLGFRREEVAHPLDGFGVLIPQVEGFRILGTLFSSSLFPHRAPPGHVTLTTYAGGARDPELAMLDTNALVEVVCRDLTRLLGLRGRPTWRHHVQFRRAIPQYEVGFGRFKQRMDEVEAQAPGFFLAGHFRNGISLGDSILAGHDAAERIDRSLPRPRDRAAQTEPVHS